MIPGSTESKATPNDCSPKTASSHRSNAHSAPGSTPGSRAPAPSPSAPCIGPWSSPKSCATAASTPSSAIRRSWAARRSAARSARTMREYLNQHIGRGQARAAPTCAPTSCSGTSSIARHGRVGIIATNTIAQGDTREVGLDQAVDMGWAIYRAEKSQPWPGTASLEVSLLWTGHPGAQEKRILDGDRVTGITPSLDPPVEDVRQSISGLQQMQASHSKARYVLGTGFILEPEEAQDPDREGPAEQGGPVPVPERRGP